MACPDEDLEDARTLAVDKFILTTFKSWYDFKKGPINFAASISISVVRGMRLGPTGCI